MAWELAQINVGRFIRPVDDPANADFMNALDAVNAVAETSPGFIWRLTGEGNNATDIRAFDDPQVAVNMSVWESVEALAAFAYRTPDHVKIMRRRREWFDHMDVYMCLWWVPAGHRPTPAEGKARLATLARLGPTPDAFSFRQPFPAPGGETVRPVLDECA
jgi:hypothetical protein